ncbi:MAG: hypothetical protein NTV73_08195 [Hyphomicrobiales bacterium]|nr:hypothetical protein [Hyphomicrobiales bacterium]
MSSFWISLACVLATVLVSLLVRALTRRFDGVLLVMSGFASMVVALFAGNAMQTQAAGGMMTLAMSETSFNLGVLSPVFIVATLSVMRGIFKFLGE